ncbi:MAG: hypothetical protein KAW19_12355 [Candidatus Aminicenantes bacterium]|nr:hypothetical protein [Candidatus Aminicenantes bacterium]
MEEQHEENSGTDFLHPPSLEMDYPPTHFGGIAEELYYVGMRLAKNTLSVILRSVRMKG